MNKRTVQCSSAFVQYLRSLGISLVYDVYRELERDLVKIETVLDFNLVTFLLQNCLSQLVAEYLDRHKSINATGYFMYGFLDSKWFTFMDGKE